ncbi:hypothetical protein PGB90_010347 [Kerria lacca]
MKIAIVGCSHGELEKIYEQIYRIEIEKNIKVNLLICCGDFQSTRNEADLRCMAVPPKYYNIGSFYKYYSGEKIAPYLTIFIGGNHEASNYLQELPYGGWVAPKIYYIGYAGVVNVGGLRIGGISGIYKPFDYMKGHFEKAPYSESAKKSVYHIRNVEVFKLKQLSDSLDIMISHDWPRGVYNYGCTDELIKNKPFFEKEVCANNLGSKPTEELLFHLKPKYWFSAHLHTRFCATVPHNSCDNTDKRQTNFMALDKCLPRRKWLEVIDIPAKEDSLDLYYDLEWLTILHLTDHLMSHKYTNQYMPDSSSDERWNFVPTEEEKEFIKEKMQKNLKIPENFVKTAASYEKYYRNKCYPPNAVVNPQTVFICNQLGITDPLSYLIDYCNEETHNLSSSIYLTPKQFHLNDSSVLDNSGEATQNSSPTAFSTPKRFLNDSTYTSFNTTVETETKKPKLSFPSIEDKTEDSSTSDILPFHIDRSGSTIETMKVTFKRRNASLYAEEI